MGDLHPVEMHAQTLPSREPMPLSTIVESIKYRLWFVLCYMLGSRPARAVDDAIVAFHLFLRNLFTAICDGAEAGDRRPSLHVLRRILIFGFGVFPFHRISRGSSCFPLSIFLLFISLFAASVAVGSTFSPHEFNIYSLLQYVT